MVELRVVVVSRIGRRGDDLDLDLGVDVRKPVLRFVLLRSLPVVDGALGEIDLLLRIQQNQ